MKPMQWTYLDTLTSENIAAALQLFRDRQPQIEIGAFALVCEQEHGAVALLQQVTTEMAMPLAGVVVPGLVTEVKFQRTGVLLIAFEASTPWKILPMRHEEGRITEAAVASLAAFAADHAAENGGDTLLLFADGMIPDVASLLDRLYLEIGDQVNYAGICVGSETFQSVPCLFDNHTFEQEAILAFVLPRHPGATLAHHYRGGEALSVATATAGSHVATINGKPAFEIYQQLMADEYGIDLDQENFYRYAVHFPLALNRGQGESLVRIPVKVEKNGTVLCSGEVRENALLSVVRAVAPGNLEAARQVGARVRTTAPTGVLGFYCAGRLMHLTEPSATVELEVLAAAVAPAPVVGALCLGEIGSEPQQYPAFHNATITALPWI